MASFVKVVTIVCWFRACTRRLVYELKILAAKKRCWPLELTEIISMATRLKSLGPLIWITLAVVQTWNHRHNNYTIQTSSFFIFMCFSNPIQFVFIAYVLIVIFLFFFILRNKHFHHLKVLWKSNSHNHRLGFTKPPILYIFSRMQLSHVRLNLNSSCRLMLCSLDNGGDILRVWFGQLLIPYEFSNETYPFT